MEKIISNSNDEIMNRNFTKWYYQRLVDSSGIVNLEKIYKYCRNYTYDLDDLLNSLERFGDFPIEDIFDTVTRAFTLLAKEDPQDIQNTMEVQNQILKLFTSVSKHEKVISNELEYIKLMNNVNPEITLKAINNIDLLSNLQ